MAPVSDESSSWSRMRTVCPGMILLVLLRVICVVPLAYPAVQLAVLDGPPVQLASPFSKQTSAFIPWQLAIALKNKKVLSGPAPRNVTLLLLAITIPDDRLYVPAFRNTTWPLGQDAMALLIWAAVAPGLSVAQIVVRLGIPPTTPGLVQSAARLGSMIPDHGWAC